ncbi:MAG: efflux RND transporter periplasmic adaptor subunit [Bacteroidota bacterium]
MKNRQLLIILFSIILIGSGVLSFMFLSGMKEEPPKKPSADMKRFVKVAPVEYGPIETAVTGLGRIASQQEIDLSPEVQGRILETSLPLKKGQRFSKGDVLVQIFDKDARYTLQARKSRFLNALANALADFKVDYPDSYPAWEAYFQSVNLDEPLPELPEIKTKQEKIYLASRNILSEYYGIKSDEVRIDKYTLRAPFSGSYTNVFLEAGSVVNPGSRIASIIRTDRLEIEVPVESTNERWVNAGDRVEIQSENRKPIGTGKVVRKSDFVDPSTQTLNVFIHFTPTGNNRVFQGEYIYAIFPGIMIEDVMEMPRNARFNNNEVYVVQDSLLKKRAINIIKLNERTLFFDGIKTGENLVVEPLANAYENMVVGMLPPDQSTAND